MITWLLRSILRELAVMWRCVSEAEAAVYLAMGVGTIEGLGVASNLGFPPAALFAGVIAGMNFLLESSVGGHRHELRDMARTTARLGLYFFVGALIASVVVAPQFVEVQGLSTYAAANAMMGMWATVPFMATLWLLGPALYTVWRRHRPIH